VIVMVGGAPVTQEYADAVGADGYAPDAATATKLAKELIQRRRAAVPA
jgi:methanogenic corrinoid protein MtbC1